MKTNLHFEILPQPDDTTCGPTCLQALYSYNGDTIGLEQVIREVPKLEGGGTHAVLLANHALARGYAATLYTYDLQVFDPTWFLLPAAQMADKLQRQLEIKFSPAREVATNAYLDFLRLGGQILLADLTLELIRGFLNREIPILTGLSSTYLYRSAREVDRDNQLLYDDMYGVPTSHFVVLSGYHAKTRTVNVADPLHPNPLSRDQYYEVKLNRLIPAIMLAALTFDANLLVLTTKSKRKRKQ